jgi:hypothetical protein
MAGPIGVEPINDWFKASLLYLFAYSPFGCSDRICTDVLRVMSPATYYLSTQLLAPSTGFEPVSACFEGKYLSPLDEDGIGGAQGIRTLISLLARQVASR